MKLLSYLSSHRTINRSMKFIDYTFDLMSNGDIVFDTELKPEQLKVENGDKFEIVLVDGAIVLRKLN